MRLVSFFMPSVARFAFGLELYAGLLVFSAYVLFDTQVRGSYVGDCGGRAD